MLPTFVIGLREGLEAALIVGIIAAFLRKQGRKDLLRWMMSGVGLALALCLAAGIALNAYSRNLPQKQQEGLETVIGALAVCMVTYMVIWMRRNSRGLKGQLEGLAAEAMDGRSNAGRAMVLMAFLAVIREGLETVVFLLAAFNEASNPRSAGFGVVLGIAVAIALGYGIYRGGVRINLSKFFRATGFVLVLVAAGIVVNALHTAHEAGWLDAGQGSTVDLSWLVRPGSVQASLLTGMLGIQARPVVAEVSGWLVYLIPVGLYVIWPPGRPAPARLAAKIGAAVGVAAALTAVVLAAATPARPTERPATTAGAISVEVVARSTQDVTVRTQSQHPIAQTTGVQQTFRLTSQGTTRHDGVTAERFAAAVPGTGAAGLPATLSVERVAALNGGRLPLSTVRNVTGAIPVTYRDASTLTVWVDSRTDRVLDLSWGERVTAVVRTASDREALATPTAAATRVLPRSVAIAAADAARAAHSRLEHRSVLHAFTGWATALAVVALLTALGFALAAHRRPAPQPARSEPRVELIRS
ncbi:iron uptake transporter permease EfeU [uncultured Jatrophihabitans sp.]|uniref:iron uptake transporter permease EfeU n=1 Tax=uncultured Jatrophihabitans sp. TaxID=1610747 RepID=UPI0035CC8D7A